MQNSEQIATGLGCNFIQQLMANYNHHGEKLFMTNRLTELLDRTGSPTLGELHDIGGSEIWKRVQQRLKRYSAFLSFAIGSMAKLIEVNEKSKESKLMANIAGNCNAPPIYAISPVEGIVRKGIYGLKDVA